MGLLSGSLSVPRFRRGSATAAVGIVANEFFDAALGRMGGFGWAARRSAECIAEARPGGTRPVLLAGRGGLGTSRPDQHESGIPLIRFDDDPRRYPRRLEKAQLGLFLTIDFRSNYLPVLVSRELPAIMWIRDPRAPADLERIATLELPSGAAPPRGVEAIDCQSLGTHVRQAGAPVVFASPAPGIATPRLQTTYGLDPTAVRFLPNPVPPVAASRETKRPRVLFLGRLDPIKRPWVFVDLARRFPGVDFAMLGQPHFAGPGSWQPTRLPQNVTVLGHVGGETKRAALRSAWLVVNTSIHESLPVSFLEALHAGTPIVSCQDPEGVTSRFGIHVGRWDGTGLDALDTFWDAVDRLLDDHDLRFSLGAAGREWARANHTPRRFLEEFATLAGTLDG